MSIYNKGDRVMKRIIKFLIFAMVLILPCFVNAAGLNYADAVHYANNFIYKFPKYNNYLIFNDNMAYTFEGGNYVIDPNYKSGGFLSKTEYEISDTNNNTYLSNGLEYWTLSKSSASRHYVINYRIQEKANADLSGVRITEYVNGNVSVTGNGSYADPWEFSEIISLHVNTTNKLRGRVSSVSCSNNSMKKETITLTFTDGGKTEVYLCPENGYKVYTNSCSSYMTKDSGNKYIINDVKKDNLICNVSFTYITNQVNLLCDGCNINPAPNTLFASTSTHDYWFTEKNGTSTPITKINTVPKKTGYTFKGFYNNSNQIINASGNMVDGATAYINGTTNLNANFEANTYTFNLNAPNATSNDHTTTGYVVYDSDIPSVTVPQRTYTVNYNANGGSVGRASDTVTYNFDGYFYNGIKYIDSNGLSVHKWDIPSDATLTGTWSNGMVTLAIPTRVGHVFNGWTINSNGTGTVYNGQQEIFNLISGTNTSVTLYAKWTKCSAGTYLSGNSCVQCSAGYYSAAGANNCSACAAGQYSGVGATSCTACRAGTYSTGASSSCSTCTAGYYCPGNSNRVSCPSGYTSASGASAQSNCYISVSAGKYLTTAGGTATAACAAGTSKAAHTVYYGNRSSCSACLKNTYSSSGAATCTKCPDGQYTTGTGSTACTGCPAGSYCVNGTNPQTCPAGQYSTMSSSSCTSCGAGTYNTGSGNSGCTRCEAGYKCTGGANREKCPAGYYSTAGSVSCTRCAAGKYSSAGAGSCSSCPAGKYSAAGASSCTSCPAGSYCPGGTNKTSCPAGTYSAAGASSCTSCPAGKYSAAGATSCSSCAAGTYSTGGASGCTTCPAGSYCPGGSNKITCAAGTYTNTTGMSSCSTCAAGKYSGAGATSCSNCAAGTYSAAGASSCSTCTKGYYCPGNSNRIACAAGTYTSTTGKSSCTTCAAGTYNSGTGNTGCTSCQAGYYCTGGTHRAACAAGKYTNTTGKSSCSTCGAGTYNSGTGNIGCSTCEAGYYCTGGTARAACPAGTYRKGTGGTSSSSCTTCEAGYYCTGGSARAACPSGTTSNARATASSSCYTLYENVWKTGKSGTAEFRKTGGNNWGDARFRLTWVESYNAYLNQSYVTVTKLEAYSGAAAGTVYAGGDSGQTKGFYSIGPDGTATMLQQMSYYHGDTSFYLPGGSWNTSGGDPTDPPWETPKYTHASDGTLTIKLRADLWLLPTSIKFSANWDKVDVPITLTDLR